MYVYDHIYTVLHVQYSESEVREAPTHLKATFKSEGREKEITFTSFRPSQSNTHSCTRKKASSISLNIIHMLNIVIVSLIYSLVKGRNSTAVKSQRFLLRFIFHGGSLLILPDNDLAVEFFSPSSHD